jgi:aryl-alcohol dehydrogenase-like predicted oxidoreductase
LKYGQIAGVDKKVSKLCQGTIMLDPAKMNYSMELMDSAFEQGINCYDCAVIYSDGNQGTFGKWVNSRDIRDEVVLFSKCAHPMGPDDHITLEMINSEVEHSLDILGFDYIDIMAMHRDDVSVPVSELVDVFNEHIAAGRVKAFGGSNWSHHRIAEANEYARANDLTPMVVSSPHFSLGEMVEPMWWGCIGISGPGDEATEARKWYAENDVAVFPWSSLGRGFFSGRVTRENAEQMKEEMDECMSRSMYSEDNFRRLDRAFELAEKKNVPVATLCVAYVLAQPMNMFPFVGGTKPQEVRENARVFEVDLTEAEIAYLELRSDGV